MLNLSVRQLNLEINHGHLQQKRKGDSKIDEQIKKYLYNWDMHHPQVVQSSIVNNSTKVKINGHTEPQLVPKLLLQVSIR